MTKRVNIPLNHKITMFRCQMKDFLAMFDGTWRITNKKNRIEDSQRLAMVLVPLSAEEHCARKLAKVSPDLILKQLKKE